MWMPGLKSVYTRVSVAKVFILEEPHLNLFDEGMSMKFTYLPCFQLVCLFILIHEALARRH